MTSQPPHAIPPRRRAPSIVGPLIIIVLGALLLLQNLGIVEWSVWSWIWQYWPVALILLGVEILLGRSSLGSAVGTVLVVVLVGLVIGAFILAGNWGANGVAAWWPAAGPIVTEPVSRPRAGVASASYRVHNGAGRIVMGSLPAGDPQLYAGTVSHRGSLVQEVTGDSHATVDLRVRGPIPLFGGEDGAGSWQLDLAPDVPADLQVRNGAGESVLDLRNLAIRDFRLQSGAGATRLTLPAMGLERGEIQGGVGELRVAVPAGTAVRFEVQHGVGAVEAAPDRYQRTATGWETREAATAADRAVVTIRTGVGTVWLE